MMMRWFFLLSLFTIPQTCAVPIVSPHVIKKIDLHIQDKLKKKEIVGCAVAIVDQGKIIFIKSYGVKKLGSKDKVNLDTLFQLGSISKPITSTLVALLKKQGILALDDAVAGYPLQVTIRSILSHTSGYSRAGWNQKIENNLTRIALLQELAIAEINVLGKLFDYHNLVYSLIEEKVQHSLNQDFKIVLKNYLLNPLGMHHTVAGEMRYTDESNYAWPHNKLKSGAWQACKSPSYAYHRSVCSAGGINSSINDMAKFLLFHSGQENSLLSQQELTSFYTPVAEAGDALGWLTPIFKGPIKSYYGLGWRILDQPTRRIVFHGGWVKGFKNFMGFVPDQHFGIVVLNNGESSFAVKTVALFFDSV